VECDPQNKGREQATGITYKTPGDIEAIFASRPRVPLNEQGAHGRHARSWCKLALQAYQSLQSEGKLRGEEAGEPDRMNHELTKCEAALAGLGSSIPRE
jgi:hypothetical protein